MSHLLLCTDLDRTLLPNGEAGESATARQRLADLVMSENIRLVYVTGRDQQLVLDAIQEYAIPIPDYVIADVGTTIYQIQNQQWHHDQTWTDSIAKSWQGQHASSLGHYLTGIDAIQLQEASRQSRFKLSYYVDLRANTSDIIELVRQRLAQQGLEVNIIWSIDEQKHVGLLDILPSAAGKRQAIEFIMHKLGFDLTNTMFAGDSGNDICVMSSPIRSVLVANASQEVRDAALQQARQNNQPQALYIARGNFMGMNGNYSAGILEGLQHYFPEIFTTAEANI